MGSCACSRWRWRGPGRAYTRDKTDHRDAYLIGKLVIRLECYLPERAGEAWARLRHLGARRFALVADVVSCMQQVSDLLACAWPAALGVAARPLEATTWLAALGVITDRCNGDPARLRKMGYEKFVAAVRRELPRWGARNVYHKIVKGLWEAHWPIPAGWPRSAAARSSACTC